MNSKTHHKIIALAITIFILAVSVSVYALVLKRDALQFHTRDYNYFIEQAARLADPQLSKRFALNIEGYNFIGLQGTEGVKSLIHAIHAEYFRYTYALLYSIFHSTLSIYLFYCLFFFLPILYLAHLTTSTPGKSWKPAVIFFALYPFFPATLYAVTADLRPRILFAAAWCLAILAVYYDRPFREKLTFVGLLLAIREEGILLATIVLAFNFLYMRGKAGRWKQSLVFLLLTAGATIAFIAFMAWGGYDRIDAAYNPLNLFANYWLLILVPALLIILVIIYFWRKQRAYYNDLLLLLVYSAAIAMVGLQMLQKVIRWYEAQSQLGPVTGGDIYLNTITDPLTSLFFYMIILLIVLLLDFTQGRLQKYLTGGAILLSVGLTITTFIVAPPQVASWRQNLEPARLIWEFTSSQDRYNTDVLADYETYQAFYNFDKVIVYNRIPVWMNAPMKIYYPDNKSIIVRLIRERMEYAVISQASLMNIREMANTAGVPVTEIAVNEHYVVLKFR